MIDTDKYEGHTPAPWELITNYSEENWDNKWVGSVHLFTTLGISFDVVGVNETDVQLIADAPLLLAEVKRLRDIVCLLEDSRIRGLSIFDRPQLFDDVLQIHTQRNEQGNGDLPPFECVGEEE